MPESEKAGVFLPPSCSHCANSVLAVLAARSLERRAAGGAFHAVSLAPTGVLRAADRERDLGAGQLALGARHFLGADHAPAAAPPITLRKPSFAAPKLPR